MSRLNKLNEKKQTRTVHERTQPEREPFRFRGLIYIFLTIALGAIVYLLFFSGALNIRSVVIEGYSKPEDLQEIVDGYRATNLLGNNILFINLEKLDSLIKENKRIRSSTLKRAWPNTLKIVIEESSEAIVWNTVGENFVIDDRGYVLEKNNNETLPVVYDNANIPVSPGERVASPTFIKYITDIWSNFELVTGQQIDRIIIFDLLSDVHVKSKSSWTVYLDSTKDPISQLESLNKVLKAAAESGHSNLQYIDMRLQDKVFYK